MTGSLVELRGVSKFYRRRSAWFGPRLAPVAVVDEVDLAIPKGSVFGLVGESGCGKSTLARLAVGLVTPSSGEVRFDGVRLDRKALAGVTGRLQMVFQDPAGSLNPRWRVRDVVAEAILHQPMRAAQRRNRVVEVLEQVGMRASDGDKFPREFSGGQRQRIAIARALAGKPEFLVCDEPTSALDVSIQAQVLNLIKSLQRELNLTCLFISHDLAVVSSVADQVGVMCRGRLVEQGDARSLFKAPRHPHTRLLVESVLSVGTLDSGAGTANLCSEN